jgi:hypothetical protein
MSHRRKKCQKISFKTKKEAEVNLEQVKVLTISKRKGSEKKNKWLHVYYCQQCQAWHIGHMQAINRQRKNGKNLIDSHLKEVVKSVEAFFETEEYDVARTLVQSRINELSKRRLQWEGLKKSSLENENYEQLARTKRILQSEEHEMNVLNKLKIRIKELEKE